MSDSINLRRVVRETMQMNLKRPWTEKHMHTFLRNAGYPDTTAEDVFAAMRWNQDKGFMDYKVDGESGQEFWKLTPKGREAE